MAFLDKHGPCWWIAERDPVTGRKRRVLKAYTDKRLSRLKLAEWERARAAGEVGALDKYAEHRHRPLAEHLREYIEDRRASGCSEGYTYRQGKIVQAMAEECEWKVLGDVSLVSLQRWRARGPLDRTRGNDNPRRLSPTGINRRLEGVRAFVRWCVGTRMGSDPLAGLDKMDSSGEIRRERRALSQEEASALVNLATPEHAAVYRFILGTGLRRRELRELQWGDVRLDAPHPFLALRMEATKARRADTVPLHPDLATMLRGRLDAAGSVEHTDRVFTDLPSMKRHRTYLRRAGIDFTDRKGRRADFHSLRHTFVTRLVEANVAPRTVQELARHTDMRLTMNRYTDPAHLDKLSAVSLISVPAVASSTFAGTGTGHEIAGPTGGNTVSGVGSAMGSAVGSAPAPRGAFSGIVRHGNGQRIDSRQAEGTPEKPAGNHHAAPKDSPRHGAGGDAAKVRHVGLEPTTR